MASNTTTQHGPTSGWTHYEVLGVSEDVSAEEIKKAHRRVVRDLHPDGKTDAYRAHFDELMKGANDAADVLLDDGQRQAYDRKLAFDRSSDQQRTDASDSAADQNTRSSTSTDAASGWEKQSAGYNRSDNHKRPGPGGSRYRRWSSAWERGRAAYEQKQHGQADAGPDAASTSNGGYGAAEGPHQAYAREQHQQAHARAVRESAKAGELGLLARIVYNVPVVLQQVGIYALCGALWAAMVYASVTVPRAFTDAPGLLPVAHIMIPMLAVCVLVPILGHMLRKRMMRMSTRMFKLQPVYWPNVEAFNRSWFLRTFLEGMLYGALWMLAAAIAPGLIGNALSATLSVCALGGSVLMAGWLAVVLSRAGYGTLCRNDAGAGPE